MGVGVHPYVPAALPPERETVPIVQEAEWALGLVWTCAENLYPLRIRSLDRLAHSESQYRLYCPGPCSEVYYHTIKTIHLTSLFTMDNMSHRKLCNRNLK